jgi:hypothetical protein
MMRPSWKTAAGLLIAAASLVAAPSHACSRVVSIPVLTEPLFDSRGIVIESTQLEIVCRSVARRAHCELEVRYRIRNDGLQLVRTRAVVHSAFLVPTAIEGAFDRAGSTTFAVLPEPDARQARADLDFDDGVDVDRSDAFELTFGPQETRTIVVHADMRIPILVEVFVSGGACEEAGIRQRHPFAAQGRPRGEYEIKYVVPAQSFDAAKERMVDVRVLHPPEWNGAIHFLTGETLMRAFATGIPGEDRARFRAERGTISIAMEVPRSTFWNGGPFLGLGWGFAPDRGVRLRVGYEVAAPFWLAHAVAVESDLSRVLTVAPSSEVITNDRLLLGVGLGLPIRVRPDARIGGRAQLSAGVGPFSIRGALDAFATGIEGSILGQVSF